MLTSSQDVLHSFEAALADENSRQLQGRINLVGQSAADLKYLYNSMVGWAAVNGSMERFHSLGLFALMELSADAYDTSSTLYRMENADLVIYMLDGLHNLSEVDFNWIARIRSINATVLVVLSYDAVTPKAELAQAVAQHEAKLARPVLPLPAGNLDAVREILVPAMLKVCPELAVPLANEIPALRAQVARHVVLQNAARCMTLGLENNVPPDLEVYTGLQMRMIREIAAIYGYKGRDRYRERLGVSLGVRWALRYSLPIMRRVKWVEGWLSSGIVSAALTLVIGFVTVLVYGGHLPRWLIRFTPYVGGGGHGSAKSSRV